MKNKFLAIILTALCLVGCTKKSSDTTENTNKKSDLSKVELTEQEKKEIQQKLKEREIATLKAETNKEIFSKFIDLLKTEFNSDADVEYNLILDGITILPKANLIKEEVMTAIKENSLINMQEWESDDNKYLKSINLFILHPEKPDTIVFKVINGTVTKTPENMKITQENIENSDKVTPLQITEEEKNMIKAQTKKDSLKDIINSLKEEFKEIAEFDYNEKLDAFALAPIGDFKEGLILLMENKDIPAENWNYFVDSMKMASKQFSSVIGDFKLSVLNPKNLEETILSVKDGEVLEDKLKK